MRHSQDGWILPVPYFLEFSFCILRIIKINPKAAVVEADFYER